MPSSRPSADLPRPPRRCPRCHQHRRMLRCPLWPRLPFLNLPLRNLPLLPTPNHPLPLHLLRRRPHSRHRCTLLPRRAGRWRRQATVLRHHRTRRCIRRRRLDGRSSIPCLHIHIPIPIPRLSTLIPTLRPPCSRNRSRHRCHRCHSSPEAWIRLSCRLAASSVTL